MANRYKDDSCQSPGLSSHIEGWEGAPRSNRQPASSASGQPVRRRDVIKLGAAFLTAAASNVDAQQRGSRGGGPENPQPGLASVRTRKGYVYNATRADNNGPMDDTTRKIVKFVAEFSERQLTPPVMDVLNKLMLDTMACVVAGFEEPPVRICARLARQAVPADLKATVLGYGISTTPELAAFANSALVRAMDFNDTGGARGTTQVGHPSDLIPAALAIGEALHRSGAEVLAAITVGYELRATPSGGEAAAAAMAAGKLMRLDEDRLANALSLALTPHYPLNKGVGAMSMWKGVRSAEAVKCGVWGAIMAREGMTGPPQPFEGRGALWSIQGRPREFTLPDSPDGLPALVRTGFKRYPAEASSQAVLDLIPEMRAFAPVGEIEWIHHEMPFGVWEEIADAPKWDSRNRETADHSLPFIIARALIDGEIYLGSYTEEKFMDPTARALVDRISCSPVAGWSGNAPGRTTIRKRSGEQKTWDIQGGRRNSPSGELLERPSATHRLTADEVSHKFERACAFRQVDNAQRDQARALWTNLGALKDVGEAIQSLASFGRPRAL